MVAAAVFANSDVAVTADPPSLTLADSPDATTMATAQVNTFKSGGFGRGVTAISHPTLLALAQSWMNTLSSVGAVVQTNRNITVISYPSTEASTLVRLGTGSMLAASATDD